MREVAGVPAARHHHHARMGQGVRHGLRALQVNRVVHRAVHHQCRHGDGAEPRADVVAAAQGGKALDQVGRGQLAPLGLPHRRIRPAIAQNGVGHHRRDAVRQAALQPGFHQSLVTHHFLGVFLQGLGVDEHQRAHQLGVRQRAAQRQVAALRHAGQHRLAHAQVRQQRRQIVGRVVVGERVAARRIGRLPVAALVPADAAPLAAQGLHLRRKHAAVHEQAVRKHNHRAVAAGVFVVQLLTIDVRERHAVLL